MAVRPVESKLFLKTAGNHLKNPESTVTKNFIRFLQFKTATPNEPFGSSDKSSPNGSKFAQVVPKIRHAHLTRDHSIWYLIDGDKLKMYGIFTHAETGTSKPANIKKQKQLATKFNNQNF